MKKIRLEFPLGTGDEYLPWKVWLKVTGEKTEAFQDQEFTIPIPETGKKISLEVEVPDELHLIEVIGLGGSHPVGNISMNWLMNEIDFDDWKIPGLQKVTIIFDDTFYEVPVINERPDRRNWDAYNNEPSTFWLFLKPWALAIYTCKTETWAEFYWHPHLLNTALITK